MTPQAQIILSRQTIMFARERQYNRALRIRDEAANAECDELIENALILWEEAKIALAEAQKENQ